MPRNCKHKPCGMLIIDATNTETGKTVPLYGKSVPTYSLNDDGTCTPRRGLYISHFVNCKAPELFAKDHTA